MPYDPSQTGSILTPTQREYLLGEGNDDLSEASERMTRKRIRERIQMGLLDLSLIVNNLDIDDIDEALTEPEEYEAEPGSSPPITNSLPALAAILYLASTPEGEEGETRAFESFTDIGVQTAVNRRGKTVEDHHAERTLKVSDSLKERAQGDLSELPEHVLKQLLTAGEITSDQYVEAWTAKQADEE